MNLRIAVLLPLALVACSTPILAPAPPRVETAAPVAEQPSYVDVPITTQVVMLERALNAKVPQTLWQIDEMKKACVPAQRIFKGKLKITPDLPCRVVGRAVRGPITVGGAGEVLTLSMPVNVSIAAKDIGRIMSKTATASARVRATARLGMTANWQPTAKIDIDYSWTQVPGTEMFGQRIKFGQKADERLRPLIAELERTLPRELQSLNARAQAEAAWRKGFTSLQLNAKNPPVWLRVTPQRIAYGGYKVVGKDIRLFLTATALTETFVGPKPDPKPVTPLPPLSFDARAASNARLFVPVVASYAELEPVVAKALGKLAKKGITVPNLGKVVVRFGKVTIYGTAGGKIAVGIEIEADSPNGLLHPKGLVWLTGMPVNAPGSQVVRVDQLSITGATDSPATNLLAQVALSADTQGALQGALTENFAKDYNEVLRKANAAIAAKRVGSFVLSAKLTKVENGRIEAYGQGLYMPVTASGAATIRFAP